jgi:hypothetical protein
MKLLISILSLTLLLVLSGCREHIGSVHVEGNSQPRFTFDGTHVSSLVVYRIPRKYLNKAIPVDEVYEDRPNVQWRVEGDHEAGVPINYGSLPEGMKERVTASPLTENTLYLTSTEIGTEDTRAFVGLYFMIRNGRVIEVPGQIDETSVDN